jgi:hypothetical protein
MKVPFHRQLFRNPFLRCAIHINSYIIKVLRVKVRQMTFFYRAKCRNMYSAAPSRRGNSPAEKKTALISNPFEHSGNTKGAPIL